MEPTHAAPATSGYPSASDENFETDELIQPEDLLAHQILTSFGLTPWADIINGEQPAAWDIFSTDYPLDLTNPMDEVTGLYNVHKAALEWQKQEEAKLRQQEGVR